MNRSLCSLLAFASLAGGVAPAALAQCDIYRLDIPDFDQRRQASFTTFGLPNNGSLHCVPTSAMNWLAYVTNHGYPEVLGGPRDWQSNTNYNAVTLWITNLATRMNTGSGTGYADGFAGLVDFLEDVSPDNFIVSVPVTTDYYAPSPEQIYECMSAGALVNFCTSRWTLTPSQYAPQPGGGIALLPERYVRSSGGHCVTVARVTDACTNAATVWFRDPAGYDGPDKFSQAQFVTQYRHTEPVQAWYAASGSSTPVQKTMYRLTTDDPDTNSMINGLYVIIPIGGLTADAVQGTISMINQHSSSDFAVLPDTRTTHSTPGNAPIISMRFLPHLGAAAVLTKTGPDQGTLYRFRPGTGEFKPLANIDHPGDMAVGLAGEIYVASRGHTGGVNVCLGDGSVRFISTGVYQPRAMGYDDVSGRLVLVLDNGSGAQAVGTIDVAASNSGASFTNDYSLSISPLAAGTSLASVTDLIIDPMSTPFNGGIYVAAGDVNGIAPLTQTPNGWIIDRTRTIPIPVPNPRNIQIDSRGRLFCTSGGVARQFKLTFNGQSTVAVLNTNYKFNGRTVGDLFQVTVGRVAEDGFQSPDQPVIDDPRSFGDSPRACDADFNLSGGLSVQDLFDFLAAFFSGSPRADINASGDVGVQDLFDYLSAYFRGCE